MIFLEESDRLKIKDIIGEAAKKSGFVFVLDEYE